MGREVEISATYTVKVYYNVILEGGQSPSDIIDDLDPLEEGEIESIELDDWDTEE